MKSNMRAKSLLVLLSCFQPLVLVKAKAIVELLYFGNCRTSDFNALYHLENTQFGMISSDTSALNTTVVFMRDMDMVGVKVKVDKCKTMEEGSCEHALTVPIRDACARETERGQFYAILGDHAHPPLTCPYKKRTYNVTNVAINFNAVASFVREHIVYVFKFIFDYRGQYAGCFMAKGKKVNVRNRKKIS